MYKLQPKGIIYVESCMQNPVLPESSLQRSEDRYIDASGPQFDRELDAPRLDISYRQGRSATERNKLKELLMGVLLGVFKLGVPWPMGMLKEEQFGEDNLLNSKPRILMAVADDGKGAAPAENATNVKFEKKKIHGNC